MTKETLVDLLKLLCAGTLNLSTRDDLTLDERHNETTEAIEFLATEIMERIQQVDTDPSDN